MKELFAGIELDGAGPVTVRSGSVPEHLDGATASGPAFEVAGRRFLLRVPNGLRVLVEDGHSVTCERPDTVSDADAALFLGGSAWGALAYQRGLVPLHVSAVRAGDGVAAFTGPSGAGKSTLAAALAARGRTHVADDTLALLTGEDASRCLPGPRRLKLWGDALDMLGIEADDPVRTDTPIDKHYVVLDDPVAPRPERFDRLYVLQERRGQPEGAPDHVLEQVRGLAAVNHLVSAVYRPRFALAMLGRQGLYEQLAPVAGAIEVFRFDRPKRRRDLDATTALVDAHLAA